MGRSGVQISAMGFGCWAIGGPLHEPDGQPLGWGEVDDAESTRAIHAALDAGVTFFDTADTYGAGHSERVLGKALGARRQDAVVATKWGNTFDEVTRIATGPDASVEYMRAAVDASLARLGTDYIDLYQLHLNGLSIADAAPLQVVAEELVAAGKIRYYGWSTDSADSARAWAEGGEHCTSVQHDFSVLNPNPPALAVADEYNLASINRGPLAMGILTGKYTRESLVDKDDVRGKSPEWMTLFDDGVPSPEAMDKLDAVRELLKTGGRTLSQGAIGWLWARSEQTIPIPGARTVAQIEENAGALAHGPLPADATQEVLDILTT